MKAFIAKLKAPAFLGNSACLDHRIDSCELSHMDAKTKTHFKKECALSYHMCEARAKIDAHSSEIKEEYRKDKDWMGCQYEVALGYCI
jgi:hypothetical protein